MSSATQIAQENPIQDQSQTAQLDLAITLILNSWPAPTLAVQSSWGGPTSGEKRDWLCGAISDLFADRPETDADDLEEVLVQVMNDEFDVAVDDGSAGEIADRICATREEVLKGEFGTVKVMWEEWKEKGDKEVVFNKVEGEDQETDGEDGDEDVDMEDAPPAPQQPRERIQPEVDEDGFTKVVGKKRK